MSREELQELKSQTGLALAALGCVFAQTLAEDDVPTAVKETLRKKADKMYNHLEGLGSNDAADMFAHFARALRDPVMFP